MTEGDFVLEWIVGISVSLSVLLLVGILFVKWYLKRKDDRILAFLDVTQSYLANYVVGNPEEKQEALSYFRTVLLKRRYINLLISQLTVLNNNFSGIYGEKAFELYRELKLYRYSIKKLKNTASNNKVRGMYELSSMEYTEAYDQIVKYINDRNGDVRRNARVAIVKLRKKEGLMSLKDLRGRMSHWTYINIVSTLKRNPVKLNPEEMNALKGSKNAYIRELAFELENIAYVS